ncbi:MAG: hypothetical protein ACRCZS_19310 [Chroococcidiopsis sp.]
MSDYDENKVQYLQQILGGLIDEVRRTNEDLREAIKSHPDLQNTVKRIDERISFLKVLNPRQ